MKAPGVKEFILIAKILLGSRLFQQQHPLGLRIVVSGQLIEIYPGRKALGLPDDRVRAGWLKAIIERLDFAAKYIIDVEG